MAGARRRADVVARPPGRRGRRRRSSSSSSSLGLSTWMYLRSRRAPVDHHNVNDDWDDGRPPHIPPATAPGDAAWLSALRTVTAGDPSERRRSRPRGRLEGPARRACCSAPGLPVVFALGIRSLALGADPAATPSRTASSLRRAGPRDRCCFAVVLAGVGAGHHVHRGLRVRQGAELRAHLPRSRRQALRYVALMTDQPSFLRRAIDWLRAGYPAGMPEQDYVALLGVLHRSLTEDEVASIAQELAGPCRAGAPHHRVRHPASHRHPRLRGRLGRGRRPGVGASGRRRLAAGGPR